MPIVTVTAAHKPKPPTFVCNTCGMRSHDQETMDNHVINNTHNSYRIVQP